MPLKSRLSLVTILGGVGMMMAAAPHVAMAAGGMGGAAGASGGKAGAGGATGGAGGAAGKAGAGGVTGASGFTQAVKPKDGGVLAGTGNKAATYAVTCEDDITGRCARTKSIIFDKKQTPPGLSGYNFNTGWIPDGSVLQVQFGVEIPAVTHVHLETPFIAEWPEAITLQTPGSRKTGQLDFNYRIKTIAKVKAEGDIFGIDFKWESDLPGVPQIDFGVTGQRTFDPWVWDGIRAEGSTNPFTLLDIPILQYATGIPDKIAGAGLKLVVFGTLGVKYNTDRIVITPSDGPITKDKVSTVHDFQQGAWAEYKFHPEGTLDYDGAITLQPEAYVKVLGKTFAIPIYSYDYPIDLPKTPYIFDDQLVHVPLPDIRLPKEGDTIDIGKVTVGEPKMFQIAFPNIGEAPVIATMYLDDAKAFQVLSKTATAEPAKDLVTKLAFYAAEPGPFTAKLLVASNDPDSPYVVVTLKGESEGLPPDPTRPPPNTAGSGGSGGAPMVDPPDEEEDGGAGGASPTGGAGGKKSRTNAVPNSGDEGSCGCRVMPQNETPRGAAFSLLALTSFLALRRQSRGASRKTQSAVPPARNTAR